MCIYLNKKKKRKKGTILGTCTKFYNWASEYISNLRKTNRNCNRDDIFKVPSLREYVISGVEFSNHAEYK